MSAFSSLSAVATEVRRGFGVDGDKLGLLWFPVFRNEILLRYLHPIHHCSSVFNQFSLCLTLNISPNAIHDLLTFFQEVSLFCKSFGDVLTDMPVTMLKETIRHRNRHCSY